MSFEWPKEWRGVCKGAKPMNLSSTLKLLYCRVHYLKKVIRLYSISINILYRIS